MPIKIIIATLSFLIGFYVILVFLGVIIVRRALAASPFRKNELSRKRV